MRTEQMLCKLQSKKGKLEKISYSRDPYNKKLLEAHERRVAHAKSFIEEIDEVIELLKDVQTNVELQLVPGPTFDKLVAKADFATVEYDGIYC